MPTVAHPSHTRLPELRARGPLGRARPGAAPQLILFRAAPTRTLTATDAAEIQRALAINAMEPTPGDTVALYVDLAEQLALPARAIMHIVAGWRSGGRA